MVVAMPMYEYECPKCGRAEDRLVPLRQADEQTCGCGEDFKRVEIPSATFGRIGFIPGVELANGQFVRGTFGDAPRKFSAHPEVVTERFDKG